MGKRCRCSKEKEDSRRKMEQLPVEVERLQDQLTEQKISPDDFFAILLSMFELDASKSFMRTVIENLKSLMEANPWGGSLREVHKDLVEKYEDFFCESVADKDDIYWSDNEERLVEGDVEKLDLGSSSDLPIPALGSAQSKTGTPRGFCWEDCGEI